MFFLSLGRAQLAEQDQDQEKNWQPAVILAVAIFGIVGAVAFLVMNVSLTPKEDKAVAQYLAQPEVKNSPFPEELTADFQQRGSWWVANGPAKDRDLKKLLDGGGKFPKFRFITSDITGDGFALLKNRGVKNVTIVDTKLDTKAMDALSEIEGMVELEIKHHCNDESLKGLHGPKSMVALSVKEAEITDEGVRIIAENCPQVEYLGLSGDKGITDGCIKYLKLFPNLIALHVSDTSLTKQGLVEIIDDIKPQKLSLAGLRLNDDFVKQHLNKDYLTVLNLSFNPITDESLEALAKLKNLNSITFKDCPKLSARGIARFKAARPKTDVREPDVKKRSKADFLLEE